MADFSRLNAIGFAGRAAERTAAVLRRELGRGTTSLQAIAGTATLLGIFATVVLLMESLGSYSEHACDYGDCSGGLSEVLVPIALGLAVAIFASVGLGCLNHRLEALDLEMNTAIFDLLGYLGSGSHRQNGFESKVRIFSP